ncbi:MAG: hypothetical protein M1813_000971 [Trichoglossum hirsutum]|nr:MAG: hypothetical protein M1813_000971 [Trichoglossum hirsutum]
MSSSTATPTTPARPTTLDPEQSTDGSPATPATSTPETKALDDKRRRLEARNANLRAQIEEVRAKRDEAQSQLRNPEAAVTVKRHIKLLHDYNEIRDVGTGLMGMIADGRGVRVKDVYAELGVEVKD